MRIQQGPKQQEYGGLYTSMPQYFVNMPEWLFMMVERRMCALIRDRILPVRDPLEAAGHVMTRKA